MKREYWTMAAVRLTVAAGLVLTAFSGYGAQVDPDGGPAAEWLELMEELQEELSDETDSTAPSLFVLSQTGVDADDNRTLSAVVGFNHHQPDGLIEAREFQYTTPRNFATRGDGSVNLWIVFHGANGNSATMNRFFKTIPHDAPTVLVYPEALRVTPENIVTTDTEEIVMWRAAKTPGSAADPNAYRDILFVERLVGRLLANNPQLNAGKVFVSGFSSGATMSWMLLCYRSSLFAGFAMFSHSLGYFRETGGCGDGVLTGSADNRTGYEKLTGVEPDRYGKQAPAPAGSVLGPAGIQISPTTPVFYAHGTADDNLIREGADGCWKGRHPISADECTIDEDPLYSMDHGGPLQDRDDISSVHWLLDRHQLLSESEQLCTIIDADPNAGEDNVTTRSHHYQAPPATGSFTIVRGEPILWYEMEGAGHSISALDQGPRLDISKDFDAALHAKSFFEGHAGMLQANQTSSAERAVGARCLLSQSAWP